MNKRTYKRKKPPTNYYEVECNWSGFIYISGVSIWDSMPGGYGFVISGRGFKFEKSGGFRRTTKHRMELMALAKALYAMPEDGRATVYTDSKRLELTFSEGWAKNWRKRRWKKGAGDPVYDADLYARCLDLLEEREVRFVYVREKERSEKQCRAKELAEAACHGEDLGIDLGYEG